MTNTPLRLDTYGSDAVHRVVAAQLLNGQSRRSRCAPRRSRSRQPQGRRRREVATLVTPHVSGGKERQGRLGFLCDGEDPRKPAAEQAVGARQKGGGGRAKTSHRFATAKYLCHYHVQLDLGNFRFPPLITRQLIINLLLLFELYPHAFIESLHGPHYKPYLQELSDVCCDYFWVFCHPNNTIRDGRGACGSWWMACR